ncbi:MAG: hypothetical protein IJM39_03915 [Firmicutes bacterium]|nr:hypothetical protein [Bacillota bacterium]
MWIRIKQTDGPSFSLPVPLVMLRSRLLWSIVEKHGGEEAAQYAPMARAMMRELSAYVRTHGHFTLVDVESADGETVKITV